MVCKTNGVTPGNGNNSVYTGKSENARKQLADFKHKLTIDFKPKKVDVNKTTPKFLKEHPEAVKDLEKIGLGEMSLEEFKTKYSLREK